MGKAGLTALKHGVRLVLEADLILLSVWDHVSNYPKTCALLGRGRDLVPVSAGIR